MSKAFMNEFVPSNIAIIIISDTRNDNDDTSGKALVELLKSDGHQLVSKTIIKDNIADMQLAINNLVKDEKVEFIITSGGTGFTKRDNTYKAIMPMLEQTIDGFGEIFRSISYQKIGTSSLLSNAFAGFIANTVIFCLPGSPSACKDAYSAILSKQLDTRTKPCNFAALLKLGY